MLFAAYQPATAQMRIEGAVLSSDGLPIPFANLTVEGTTAGTAADIEGQFILTLNPSEYKASETITLVAAAIGFASSQTHVVC